MLLFLISTSFSTASYWQFCSALSNSAQPTPVWPIAKSLASLLYAGVALKWAAVNYSSLCGFLEVISVPTWLKTETGQKRFSIPLRVPMLSLLFGFISHRGICSLFFCNIWFCTRMHIEYSFHFLSSQTFGTSHKSVSK